MAVTLSGDLYSPEVWADLATQEFQGKVVVANSPAVKNLGDLEGRPGDTVVFPKWSLLTEMPVIQEQDVLVPEKLTQTSSRATIQEAGKAVEFSDTAKLTGIGNVQDEALRQFGILSARRVDADLIAAATAVETGGITHADGTPAEDSAPLTATLAGGFTYENLVTLSLLFEDDFDPADFGGVYLNPADMATIMKDRDFISSHQGNGANRMIHQGSVGTLYGLNFFVTSRLAKNKALVLKRDSLGLMYKRRPIVERDRDILARTTVIATNLHYGCKRLVDKGVIDVTLA